MAAPASLPMLPWITLLRLPAYSEILLTFAVLGREYMEHLSGSAARSELAVMRAGGMSAWQFLAPGATLSAFVIGMVRSCRSIIRWQRRHVPRLSVCYAEVRSARHRIFLSQQSGLPWMRQDGNDGPSVIWAATVRVDNGLYNSSTCADPAIRLATTSYVRNAFNGKKCAPSRWPLDCRGWLGGSPGRAAADPSQDMRCPLICHRTGFRTPWARFVHFRSGSCQLSSIWPSSAGLKSAPYHIQFQQLLVSRPFLLALMVLLAGTVSLKSFRSGGVQTMVVAGISGGHWLLLDG